MSLFRIINLTWWKWLNHWEYFTLLK